MVQNSVWSRFISTPRKQQWQEMHSIIPLGVCNSITCGHKAVVAKCNTQQCSTSIIMIDNITQSSTRHKKDAGKPTHPANEARINIANMYSVQRGNKHTTRVSGSSAAKSDYKVMLHVTCCHHSIIMTQSSSSLQQSVERLP